MPERPHRAGRYERLLGRGNLNLRAGHATDAKLDALVRLALAVTETKGHIAPEILDAFFAAGYTKGNLVDVMLQVSDKIAMNYLQNLTKCPSIFPRPPSCK